MRKPPLYVDGVPGVALEGGVFRFALATRSYDPESGAFTKLVIHDLIVPRDVVFATINRVCLALLTGGRRGDLDDLRAVEKSLREPGHQAAAPLERSVCARS